jgi:hypothetical protein
MISTIHNKLDELAAKCDRRTSVFDVQMANLTDYRLTLSGCVLERSQVEELRGLFPDLELDTSSIFVLNRPGLPRLSVATNLTGLYEKPGFGMPLASELCFGTKLEILEEQGKWVFTRQKDGYLGWAYRHYLSEPLPPEATHLVLAPAIELHVEPNETSEVMTRAASGTGVHMEETRDGWSRISANKTGWIPSSSLRALADVPMDLEGKRAWMHIDSARMIGVPYLWGGTSGNGIDCSGFVRLLHRWVGVDIPRDADMQCNAARPLQPPYEIGDLLFFGEGTTGEPRVTHVGMSLGGWKVIHSSRSRNGVYVDDLQENQSLRDMFISAGTFLGN